MGTAEKFIQDYTNNCSNAQGGWVNGEYNTVFLPWLTPDQARKAVEIAKEEVIEKTLDFLKDKLYENGYVGIIDLCDDYIKTMKDE